MRLVYLLNHFPELSETFVVEEIQALRRLGHEVRVETGVLAARPAPVPDPPPVTVLADDGLARRLVDLAWLAVRSPRGVVADLRSRRRWSREEAVHPLRVLAPAARRLDRAGERHVHVHFGDVAALDALRLHRLTGVGYSVTAHAFEIYRSPTNLEEKLTGAAVAFGVCGPAVDELRRRAPRARIELQAMGVDPARFRRSRPQPGGRHVIAVGRLVEKKGFVHLIEAAADARLDRLTLVGDGPERAALELRAQELGVLVEFAGARDPAEVPGLLEDADVLAVPSVVAADGDRDALPVVVQEALAMELPVVVSDVMGLPEVVQDTWGRVVPAGDSAALAAALADVLDRPPPERADMGRAGRAFVLTERSVDAWAERLAATLGGLPSSARR